MSNETYSKVNTKVNVYIILSYMCDIFRVYHITCK